MINEINYLEKVQVVPEDSPTINKKDVMLQRTWVLWENYQHIQERNSKTNEKDKDYNLLIKKVVTFDDLITFWQFWNVYPGSHPKEVFYDGENFNLYFDSKKRIDGLNLFTENISPKWEDSQNSNGKIFQIQFDIKEDMNEFLDVVKDYWLKLVLYLIGESLPCNHLVRF